MTVYVYRMCPTGRTTVLDASRTAALSSQQKQKQTTALNNIPEETTSLPPVIPYSNTTSTDASKYAVGDRVEVIVDKEQDYWNAGKIQAVSESDNKSSGVTYRVRLLDGTILDHVEEDDIRGVATGRSPMKPASTTPMTNAPALQQQVPLASSSDSTAGITTTGILKTSPSRIASASIGSGAILIKGSKVTARIDKEWLAGEVVKVRFNGTFDVKLDTTEQVVTVNDENIRDYTTGASPVKREPRDKRVSIAPGTARFRSVVDMGLQRPAVEAAAESNNSNKESVATVVLAGGNNTSTNKRNHKKKGAVQVLENGTRVTVRSDGNSWVHGVIGRCTGPAVYDVLLDSNKLIQNVPEAYLHVTTAGDATITSFTSAVDELRVGSQVDVKPKGSDKHLPGVIVVAHRQGLFDVQLYEGSYLQSVSSSAITVAAKGQYVSSNPGQRVLAYSPTPASTASTSTLTSFGVLYHSVVSSAKWTPFIAFIVDHTSTSNTNRYSTPGCLPPGTEVSIVPT